MCGLCASLLSKIDISEPNRKKFVAAFGIINLWGHSVLVLVQFNIFTYCLYDDSRTVYARTWRQEGLWRPRVPNFHGKSSESACSLIALSFGVFRSTIVVFAVCVLTFIEARILFIYMNARGRPSNTQHTHTTTARRQHHQNIPKHKPIYWFQSIWMNKIFADIK